MRLLWLIKIRHISRATYFSQSPTDKMYSVVAAAKALHEQLRIMEEGSIDGGKMNY